MEEYHAHPMAVDLSVFHPHRAAVACPLSAVAPDNCAVPSPHPAVCCLPIPPTLVLRLAVFLHQWEYARVEISYRHCCEHGVQIVQSGEDAGPQDDGEWGGRNPLVVAIPATQRPAVVIAAERNTFAGIVRESWGRPVAFEVVEVAVVAVAHRIVRDISFSVVRSRGVQRARTPL